MPGTSPRGNFIPTLASVPGGRVNRWLSISLAAHAIVIAAFLYHRPQILKATALPGDASGHHLLLSYAPGAAAPPSPAPLPKPAPTPLPDLHIPAPPPPPPSTANTPSITPSTSTGAGTDTFGDGNIKIASVIIHPRPTPDLSNLPASAGGDVIVDVVIDTNGHIAKYQLEHGLGHGVDETVIATIQGWTFTPATRNGVPVASEQELLFHYERG